MWKGSSSSPCPSLREDVSHQSGLLLMMPTSGKPDKRKHHPNQSNRACQALYGPPNTFPSPFSFAGSNPSKAFQSVHEGEGAGVLSVVSLWVSWPGASSKLPVKGSVVALMYFAVRFAFSSILLVQVFSCSYSDHTGGAIFCSNTFLCWLCSCNSGLVFAHHKKGRGDGGSLCLGCILMSLKYGGCFLVWDYFFSTEELCSLAADRKSVV